MAGAPELEGLVRSLLHHYMMEIPYHSEEGEKIPIPSPLSHERLGALYIQ